MIIFHTNGLTVNGDCSVVDAENNSWGHVTKFGDKWLWDNGEDTKWYSAAELLRIKDLLDLLNYYLPDFSSVYPVKAKATPMTPPPRVPALPNPVYPHW